ncbi:MAG: alpha/beta fold hydrolase [Usitatibacter sp.]
MRREAGYFGEGADSFFGWRHSEGAAVAGDRVAVICGPVGHEYTRAHRTLRHLADRFARAGIPAVRFDYHGIGDSPGTDLDPDRMRAWQENVRTAIAEARAWSGCRSVCLVGVRLGATLAAVVARDVEVAELVLWNPVVRGRPYVRELQAIAMSAERAASEVQGALESAGSIMSAQTLEALRAVNLLETAPRAGRVLVAGRDDHAPDASLNEFLTEAGVRNEYVRLPGWADMMAEHQFTVVPDAALDEIVGWVLEEPGAARGLATPPRTEARQSIVLAAETDAGRATLEERLCAFGDDGQLFGVLTRASAATDNPAVVIFNAGAVHRVGPNRVNVTLARHLAAAGLPCLRFDLEGLGDSVLRTAGRENHPYPATAICDARAAIAYLRREHGYTRFIAVGLCSGAHNAFHAGLELEDEALVEVVLINPLTFYWKEGMSLETTRHFEDAIQYRKSMRDPGRWLKLLRGGVDMRRLAHTVIAQARTKLKSQRDAVRELVLPRTAPRLSRDLRRLLAAGRAVSLFVAEGDPGRDILMAGARRTATHALRSGAMRLEMIPGADHTFSQLAPRRELVRRLADHLRRHLPPRPGDRAHPAPRFGPAVSEAQ